MRLITKNTNFQEAKILCHLANSVWIMICNGKEAPFDRKSFFDIEERIHQKEFLRFVKLNAAKSIAEWMKDVLLISKYVRPRCDGCAAISGNIGEVQEIMWEKYKIAVFFHCRSYRLNLVINDLNHVRNISSVDELNQLICAKYSETMIHGTQKKIPKYYYSLRIYQGFY